MYTKKEDAIQGQMTYHHDYGEVPTLINTPTEYYLVEETPEEIVGMCNSSDIIQLTRATLRGVHFGGNDFFINKKYIITLE